MKTLILIRHAKSDWNDASLADFNRLLNKRGMGDAPIMAEQLTAKGIKPDLLLSSPALRAITTAGIFADILHYPPIKIKRVQKLYNASVADILRIINGINNKFDCVLLFGHNPGISLFLNYLTGEQIEMPTCAIACVKLMDDDWSLVSSETGVVEWYDYPKAT